MNSVLLYFFCCQQTYCRCAMNVLQLEKFFQPSYSAAMNGSRPLKVYRQTHTLNQ